MDDQPVVRELVLALAERLLREGTGDAAPMRFRLGEQLLEGPRLTPASAELGPMHAASRDCQKNPQGGH